MNEDLQRSKMRQADIETLQTAFMGVIRQSGNRKVDIDDLRQLLATQLKAAKVGGDSQASLVDSMQVPTRQRSRSRSKSKGHTHQSTANPANTLMMGPGSFAEARSSAATLKVQQAFDEDSATPAWYRTLKKGMRD